MLKRFCLSAFAVALTFGLASTATAQTTVPAPDPIASPHAMSKVMMGDTYIKVTYGSPRKRGRVIFGELEQYGEVWRLGANDATEITFTDKVNFGGEMLDAGTYTLFAVPMEDKWNIIVNSDLGQWGAYRHNTDNDVATVEVPVEIMGDSHEAFTMAFEEVEGGVHLNMMWDTVKAAVPIKPAM